MRARLVRGFKGSDRLPVQIIFERLQLDRLISPDCFAGREHSRSRLKPPMGYEERTEQFGSVYERKHLAAVEQQRRCVADDVRGTLVLPIQDFRHRETVQSETGVDKVAALAKTSSGSR